MDQLIDGWAAERPDLDTSALAVVYRLTRIAAVWSVEIERLLAGFGLTPTDFAVLANLRRAGAPYQLNQRRIMEALRLTSGTVSLRIDKMAERGLVSRATDPANARASVVTLTDAGARLFDRVAPEHLANETRLLAALPEAQRETLADLLRVVLLDIEQPTTERPDARLGFVAVAAAVTQRKRAELGLPGQNGLLVESVVRDGPAERAGVRAGDTIVRLGDTPLYSLPCLERAIASRTTTTHTATVMRAGRSVTVQITVPALRRNPDGAAPSTPS